MSTLRHELADALTPVTLADVADIWWRLDTITPIMLLHEALPFSAIISVIFLSFLGSLILPFPPSLFIVNIPIYFTHSLLGFAINIRCISITWYLSYFPRRDTWLHIDLNAILRASIFTQPRFHLPPRDLRLPRKAIDRCRFHVASDWDMRTNVRQCLAFQHTIDHWFAPDGHRAFAITTYFAWHAYDAFALFVHFWAFAIGAAASGSDLSP